MLRPCPKCGKATSGKCCQTYTPNHQSLYNNRKWRQFRQYYLADNPLCQDCKANNRITPASEVHHILPHKGDEYLFWNNEFKALCRSCHTKITNSTRI